MNVMVWIKGGQPYYQELGDVKTEDEILAALVGTVTRSIEAVRRPSARKLRIYGKALHSEMSHTWDIYLPDWEDDE